MQQQSKNNNIDLPFNWTQESSCVFYVKDSIVIFTEEMKLFLKSCAAQNDKREARLCTHLSPESTLHEMIIVHRKGNYVPPHRHYNKVESFHIMEGKLAIVIFNNDGSIIKAIHLSRDGDIYYKLQEPMYHSIIPLTDYVIYHEITDGPFILDDKDEAKWAPRKENSLEVKAYQKEIIGKI